MPPFVRRIRIKNYLSIAECDVALGRLTFLLGPNGAGKSNFLDALRFVAEALRNNSLDHALRDRGGLGEVRRRNPSRQSRPSNFWILLDLRLPSGSEVSYGFEISARPDNQFAVKWEECRFSPGGNGFTVEEGNVKGLQQPPPATADRLYLVNAAGLPEFRELYDGLSSMGFYNLVPGRMRNATPPHPGQLLDSDGSNIASVVGQLAKSNPATKTRVEEYLRAIVPGIEGVDRRTVLDLETLEFRQQINSHGPWRIPAIRMSEGTLRALGVLVALLQPQDMKKLPIPLVGIEEPEIALHPAAAGVVRDCLRDAARIRQVLVTSHSPDLIDDPKFDLGSLLAVSASNGQTRIGPLSASALNVLQEQLATPGELLRQGLIEPAPPAAGEPA